MIVVVRPQAVNLDTGGITPWAIVGAKTRLASSRMVLCLAIEAPKGAQEPKRLLKSVTQTLTLPHHFPIFGPKGALQHLLPGYNHPPPSRNRGRTAPRPLRKTLQLRLLLHRLQLPLLLHPPLRTALELPDLLCNVLIYKTTGDRAYRTDPFSPLPYRERTYEWVQSFLESSVGATYIDYADFRDLVDALKTTAWLWQDVGWVPTFDVRFLRPMWGGD